MKPHKMISVTSLLVVVEGESGELSPFLQNILASSTEYSIIGKDLGGKILLSNQEERHLFFYAPEEVINKAKSSLPRTPEDCGGGLVARNYRAKQTEDKATHGEVGKILPARLSDRTSAWIYGSQLSLNAGSRNLR